MYSLLLFLETEALQATPAILLDRCGFEENIEPSFICSPMKTPSFLTDKDLKDCIKRLQKEAGCSKVYINIAKKIFSSQRYTTSSKFMDLACNL